jgi:hypothetical protein
VEESRDRPVRFPAHPGVVIELTHARLIAPDVSVPRQFAAVGHRRAQRVRVPS